MIFNLVNTNNILKLKVVTGTEEEKPGNATQGTIFVVTDTPHTSYVYSTEEPSEPAEAMIWIRNGQQINKPVLAFQKSGGNYYISPTGVYQYLNGAWVKKRYYIYDETENPQDLRYYIMDNYKFNPLYDWSTKGNWARDGGESTDKEVDMKYENGTFYQEDQSGYYYWCMRKLTIPIDVTDYSFMKVNATSSVQAGLIYCGDSYIKFAEDPGEKYISLENINGYQTLKIELHKGGEGAEGQDGAQLSILSWYFE